MSGSAEIHHTRNATVQLWSRRDSSVACFSPVYVVNTHVLGTMFQFVRRTPSKSRDCACMVELSICPKDTEQVRRLCQSTERYLAVGLCFVSPVHVVNTPILGTM